MEVEQVVAVVVAAVGAVVALCVLIPNSRGQVRVLAVIGTLLILLGVVTRFAYLYLRKEYLAVMQIDTIVNILSADLVIGGLVTGVGLLLITRALLVAS